MNGKHYARTTSQRERGCSLIHGSWRRAGIKIAATGACALVAGQLLLPSVALAMELENGSETATDAAVTAVAPSTSSGDASAATASTPASADGSGSTASQQPSADARPAAGSQGAQAGASDGMALSASSESSGGASGGRAASGAVGATASSAQTQGVSGAAGGSNITVKTTVRNNYTDTREDRTVDLLDGAATVKGDYSSLSGKTLAFEGLGSLRVVEASYDEASKQTTIEVDTSGVARQREERTYETAYTEFKNMMTTTYTGSKLTYTGTTYEPGVVIGNPDEAFGDPAGNAVINEIRDDYYTRNHVWVKFRLTVPAAEPSAISTVTVVNVKTDYAPGEVPRMTATIPAVDADKYEIAYECWEEMDGSDPRDLQPVAYWYSDAGKYPTGAKRIAQFEEGKFYMYSVELRLKDGSALAEGYSVVVNGLCVNGAVKTVNGVFAPNAANMLCEQPIGEERAIDVVEIDGATTAFKTGDKPVFTAGVSDTSNSIFQCEFWMGSDGSEVNSVPFWDENVTDHVDAFKSGVTYRYGFYLKAQRGFYFTRDTKVKINGKLYTFTWSESDEDAFDRWDGRSDTMWVYSDLTMTPEATAAPTDPGKPSTGGPETPTPAPGTESGQEPGSTDGGREQVEPPSSTVKTTSSVKATKTAKAKQGKKAAAANPLPATGDDAALTVVAMGVAGATVAAAGIAASRRRS